MTIAALLRSAIPHAMELDETPAPANLVVAITLVAIERPVLFAPRVGMKDALLLRRRRSHFEPAP